MRGLWILQLHRNGTMAEESEANNLTLAAIPSQEHTPLNSTGKIRDDPEIRNEMAAGSKSIADHLGSAVEQLRHDAEDLLNAAVHPLQQSLLKLDQRISSLEQAIAADGLKRDSAGQDIIEQIVDVRSELTHHRALLSGARQGQSEASAALAKEPAVRALIVAEAYLEKLRESVSLEHLPVVAGQRENLRATLRQLGVEAIEPAPGSQLDPARHRSVARTTPTGSADLHDRIAEVQRTGWEYSGGGLIQHADVAVYLFDRSVAGVEGPGAGLDPPSTAPASTPKPRHGGPVATKTSKSPKPTTDGHSGNATGGSSAPEVPYDWRHEGALDQ